MVANLLRDDGSWVIALQSSSSLPLIIFRANLSEYPPKAASKLFKNGTQQLLRHRTRPRELLGMKFTRPGGSFWAYSGLATQTGQSVKLGSLTNWAVFQWLCSPSKLHSMSRFTIHSASYTIKHIFASIKPYKSCKVMGIKMYYLIHIRYY